MHFHKFQFVSSSSPLSFLLEWSLQLLLTGHKIYQLLTLSLPWKMNRSMHINWWGRRVDRPLFILDYRSSSALAATISARPIALPSPPCFLPLTADSWIAPSLLYSCVFQHLHGAARLQDPRVSYLGHRITALRHYHFISMDPSAEAHVTDEGIVHFKRVGTVDRQVNSIC
jgi:hypothetical protein